MSTTAPTGPSRRERPPQATGQWALGQTEPLNDSERMKHEDNGLNVRERILSTYSREGFASIDPQDLHGRMRWWGLYTQRRPGIDGGRTAVLSAEELEDEYFMMRLRLPAGRLSPEQLKVVGRISQTYARDTADITDRQTIQFHWIRIEDVPAIWDELAAVGLSTQEACGDTPRNILGCPLAGVAEDEIVDATADVRDVEARYVGDPELANLPRKFKSSFSGCRHHCAAHEINDVSFVGVEGPDGRPGYDVWVGGGLSTNPMLAQRLGVFVEPGEVAEVWHGVTRIFRDYGYRKSRNRARLKFLVADWGAERFREVLEKEYLGRALPDGPAAADPPGGVRDHVGVGRQKDGLAYVGAAPRVGRISGTVLLGVGELAERHGSGRVHLTAQQKLVLLDVAPDGVDALVAGLEALDLAVRPSPFRRSTMACTGIEYCKLAIVETKARAMHLTDELERRLPDFDQPLSIHVNGCPNSCARFQVADIGLKGMLVDGPDGDKVEGFQVHLGGALGHEAGLGRKLRGHKVAADDLPDWTERVLRHYLDGRADGESFASWATRADEVAFA